MTWREAFLVQARSDDAVRRLLNRNRTEYAHQLHYLQMATEKLAKAIMMRDADAAPPAQTHVAFVSCLWVIKGRPELRRQLGYEHAEEFRSFIDSLLPLAERIERLAPNLAGMTQPNPEYPWRPAGQAEVFAPSQYDFPQFTPLKPQMAKLVALVENLLRVVN
jgi:hypothetical protein